MAETRENLTEWLADLMRRAAREQGRAAQMYGAILQQTARQSGGDPVGALMRFGANEVGVLLRASAIASLLYCDALLAALKKSNDRLEHVIRDELSIDVPLRPGHPSVEDQSKE